MPNSLWLLLGFIIALGAAGYSTYKSGEAHADKKCLAVAAAADHEGNVEHDKIEKRVMGLSDPDLDRRLDRWVR